MHKKQGKLMDCEETALEFGIDSRGVDCSQHTGTFPATTRATTIVFIVLIHS